MYPNWITEYIKQMYVLDVLMDYVVGYSVIQQVLNSSKSGPKVIKKWFNSGSKLPKIDYERSKMIEVV